MSEGWRLFILRSLPQHSPLQQALLHKHQRTRTQTHPRHTHAHRHTTHEFRSSVTQLWLGSQATEQHASLSISTAPRRLKPNFQTYLACQEPFPCCDQDMGVVVIPSKVAGHNLFVARRDSCQTNIHEKRFHGTFSVDLRIQAPCQNHVFWGGPELEFVLRELPRKCRRNPREKVPKFERENVTASLEKSSEI